MERENGSCCVASPLCHESQCRLVRSWKPSLAFVTGGIKTDPPTAHSHQPILSLTMFPSQSIYSVLSSKNTISHIHTGKYLKSHVDSTIKDVTMDNIIAHGVANADIGSSKVGTSGQHPFDCVWCPYRLGMTFSSMTLFGQVPLHGVDSCRCCPYIMWTHL